MTFSTLRHVMLTKKILNSLEHIHKKIMIENQFSTRYPANCKKCNRKKPLSKIQVKF